MNQFGNDAHGSAEALLLREADGNRAGSPNEPPRARSPDAISRAPLGNRLLAMLPGDEYARLEPLLGRRSGKVGDTFIHAGRAIDTLFFPERGLISLILSTDPRTEVGVIGPEGAAGVNILLGVETSVIGAVCQIPGTFLTLPASLIRDQLHSLPALQRLLHLYAHTLVIQAASTVLANAHFTVEQRLARWLLLAHDRVEGDEIGLTHDFLAVMLCVRRPGVTVATHVLEGNGLIRARRGRITVLNRDGLKKLAGESYGLAERDYDRLIGTFAAERRHPG